MKQTHPAITDILKTHKALAVLSIAQDNRLKLRARMYLFSESKTQTKGTNSIDWANVRPKSYYKMETFGENLVLAWMHCRKTGLVLPFALPFAGS